MENVALVKPESTTPAKNITKLINATILPGASAQGNPSYDPGNVKVSKNGEGVQWTDKDNVPHTVTSLKDDGKTFDSSIIKPNSTFVLDASGLAAGEYAYFCTLHPYMKGLLTVTN